MEEGERVKGEKYRKAVVWSKDATFIPMFTTFIILNLFALVVNITLKDIFAFRLVSIIVLLSSLLGIVCEVLDYRQVYWVKVK